MAPSTKKGETKRASFTKKSILEDAAMRGLSDTGKFSRNAVKRVSAWPCLATNHGESFTSRVKGVFFVFYPKVLLFWWKLRLILCVCVRNRFF
jgi:hypothetical protein